jgi:O-antigen/teichoic acid export membrane protein
VPKIVHQLKRNRFARDVGVTYVSTGVTLVLNLATGVVIARSLGPSGRGVLTAILTMTQVAATVFAVGAMAAVSYHVARNPDDCGRLVSTWMLILLPFAVLAVVVVELLIPTLFAAQSEHSKDLARLYAITLVVTLFVQPIHGIITGERRTALWSWIRVSQPLTTLVILAALSIAGHLTLESALIATLVATVLTAALALAPTLTRHGWKRPSVALGAATLAFGLKGLGSTVTQAVNMRLDLLIMPAFLGAASVGLYSVATNVSWLLVAISAPMWWLIMPTAAGQGSRGHRTILASFYVTLGASLALAVALAGSAGWLIPTVYGDDFSPAVTSLYVLLPGSVLLAGSTVMTSGIYAAGRPFTATTPHLLGSVVTVGGLALLLKEGGIEAAAAVTSTSYAVVTGTSVVLYSRVAGVGWRAWRPTRAMFRADKS